MLTGAPPWHAAYTLASCEAKSLLSSLSNSLRCPRWAFSCQGLTPALHQLSGCKRASDRGKFSCNSALAALKHISLGEPGGPRPEFDPLSPPRRNTRSLFYFCSAIFSAYQISSKGAVLYNGRTAFQFWGKLRHYLASNQLPPSLLYWHFSAAILWTKSLLNRGADSLPSNIADSVYVYMCVYMHMCVHVMCVCVCLLFARSWNLREGNALLSLSITSMHNVTWAKSGSLKVPFPCPGLILRTPMISNFGSEGTGGLEIAFILSEYTCWVRCGWQITM